MTSKTEASNSTNSSSDIEDGSMRIDAAGNLCPTTSTPARGAGAAATSATATEATTTPQKRNTIKTLPQRGTLPHSSSYKSLAVLDPTHPDDDDDKNNNNKDALLLDASMRSYYAPPEFVSNFYCAWASRWHNMAVKMPLPLLCILLFLVVCGTSIAICIVVGNSKNDVTEQEALDLAIETGDFFSNQLDRAILPLFSMAQFTAHLDLFQKLPKLVGPAHQPGSLPMIIDDDDEGSSSTHRNVTGVCDDPELVTRFTDIATGVKRMANMDGILVNIQLAPQGVLCLLHPMNNTEDFEDGKFLDSTGAWGLDLFESPSMKFIAMNSIKNDFVGVAGPLTLIQCPTCDPFFIARLPIVDEYNTITVGGVSYPRWGFATALIDWSKLVKRSGIYDSFASSAFEFQLTRTDTILNEDTGMFEEKIVVLAQSFDFDTTGGKDVRHAGFVSTSLETTNNEWVMTVQYDNSSTSLWLAGVSSICVVVSFFVSYLVYTVLRQQQTHAEMTADTVTQQAMIDTERNMTAYFAHELRNPLSALDNALRTLNAEDEEEKFSESTKELIDGMQLCSTFMSSIMNNLLDVRKLEEGKMAFRPEPILLAGLVEDSHSMMKAAVRDGVEFKVINNTIPKDRKWVIADSHRIQQVLSNVLSNAIKYTLEGSITLTVAWTENDLVQFECIDTGPGIPKSEQEKLFERFVQRGGAPGTGLGLNIAKKIVRMMNGTIEFVSDPTVRPGTTCRILLPLEVYVPPPEDNVQYINTTSSRRRINPTSSSSPAKKEELIEEPISVLIMDDIKMNRNMLKRRLQKAVAPNADLVLVSTGEEALQVCRERNFDIAICDQYMEEAGGVMLGTDTIIAMRREKINCFIIGCSGNDLNGEFMGAGADMVWGKPMPSNDEIIQQFRMGLQTKKNM